MLNSLVFMSICQIKKMLFLSINKSKQYHSLYYLQISPNGPQHCHCRQDVHRQERSSVRVDRVGVDNLACGFESSVWHDKVVDNAARFKRLEQARIFGRFDAQHSASFGRTHVAHHLARRQTMLASNYHCTTTFSIIVWTKGLFLFLKKNQELESI